MIIRNELEIVYATLYSVVSSFPKLNTPPNLVPDYSVDDVKAGPFPLIGIKRFGDPTEKMIDKSDEYKRTEHEGKTYAWYETGRFDYGCTVGLFVSQTAEIYNPVPFLREWEQHVTKVIRDKIRFPTIGDVIQDELVRISLTAQPMEREGKLIYSTKLSVNVQGKLLTSEELKPISTGTRKPWIIHSNPDLFK